MSCLTVSFDFNMFNIGDSVVYGANGVCTILDIREESFAGVGELYYILMSECDSQTIFVPVANQRLTERMKPAMSTDEAYEFIDSLPALEPLEWNAHNRQRNELFKEILLTGNRCEIAKLLKSIHNHRESQARLGKKLYLSDETMMKRAEKLLHSELAYSLGIKTEEVLPLIEHRLGC